MNLFDLFDDKDEPIEENLRKWFKEKWVRFGPDGKIRGDCARGDDSEGKPKCLPQAKAHSLGKEGRASAAARKRREDPNPERSGKAINVATKKNSNEGVAEEQLDEKQDACYHKVKSRYKVWPSAYASGALVQCRKKGAKNWGNKSKNESVTEDAESLHIGDPVIVTGNVNFKGKTGDIVEFGKDRRFVVVDLYNHGRHSFHSSDVSYNDYADQEDEFNESVGVINLTFDDGSTRAIRTGGAINDPVATVIRYMIRNRDFDKLKKLKAVDDRDVSEIVNKIFNKSMPMSESTESGRPRIRKHTVLRPDGSKAVRYEVLNYRGVLAQGGFDDIKYAREYALRNYERLSAPHTSVDETVNPTDTVKMDVPLLLRVMEYSKEDAKTDMDLHNVVTNLVDLSKTGETLTMKNYDDAVEDTEKPNTEPQVVEQSGRYWCKTDRRWKDR